MKTSGRLEGLTFVTGNANKVREAEQILGVEIRQMKLAGAHEIQTNDLDELVRHKAEQAFREVGGPVLVEDSGLVFTAWNGLPGALVKWFECTVGLSGMLKMLQGFDDRSAIAHCSVALHDGERLVLGHGEVTGRVAETLRGEGGFGWDALFIPDGHDRTYGEMAAGEKNAISHRRRAFEALKKNLE